MTIPNVLFGQHNQYSADILGNGVFIPEYADNPVIKPGMTFSGIVTDGGTDFPFSGRLVNNIGRGYSPLDGYGFINAEKATSGRRACSRSCFAQSSRKRRNIRHQPASFNGACRSGMPQYRAPVEAISLSSPLIEA